MFINYAHRGASAYAPGNTLAAFYLGLECGANGIETDVRMSRDGVPVLFHDKTLESAGRPGAVTDYSFRELREMLVVNEKAKIKADRILSFEDFLVFFGFRDLSFAVEIKQEGIEKEVIALVRKYGIEKKTVITSFSFSVIENVKKIAPGISVGYLVRVISEDSVNKLLSVCGEQICPHSSVLDFEAVNALKAMGLSVRAWGVNNEETMRKMYDIGTDGMTIDFPDKLTEYIKARAQR